jgi:Fic family protein
MFSPKYSLSPKILENIAQSERFYGKIESLRIPTKLELNLERNNLLQSSYISNSIEGNPLSLPEVTNLLLGDRIPVNRDEKEVKNYFEILKSLEKYKNVDLDVNLILEIHRTLLKGVKDNIAGNIRNKPIIVGNYKTTMGERLLSVKHNPPFHKKTQIECAINELIKWINTVNIPVIVETGIFHHQFVYIHPFEDGNGRVCRLITALLFIRKKYQINKYFVLDDYYDIDRKMYSDKLHSADKGNKTEWLEYFTDGVKYSLQSALGKHEKAIRDIKLSEKVTDREKEVIHLLQQKEELTSVTIAEKLRVSRQQAHALLSSLVNKGFIGKKGKTKSSFYFIK